VNYDRVVRSIAPIAVLASLAILACRAPTPAPTTTLANVTGPTPPRRITCYAGSHLGTDGERAPIYMRRTLDQGTSTIRQESILGSNGFGFVTDWVADFTVTGDTFRSKTTGGRGEGHLEGPPWAWTHWTELRGRDDGTDEGPTEQVDGWLDGTHLRFEGRILAFDKRWTAEMDAIDCADFQPRIDALDAIEKENGPRDP
jgi:hypothetical protein